MQKKLLLHIAMMLNYGLATFNAFYFFLLVSECPPGMEYQTCSWNITCDEFGVVRDCRNSTCQSGCFCSNGYVLEDGLCVHFDTCTGLYNII